MQVSTYLKDLSPAEVIKIGQDASQGEKSEIEELFSVLHLRIYQELEEG